MPVVQRLSDNAPEIGGGVTGVGGVVALREFADVRNGQVTTLLGQPGTTLGRATRPSVAYGVGTGLLAGLGWWLGGRGSLNDFLLAHAITGVPSGAVSALMPKQATTTTAGAGARTRTRTRAPRERRPAADGGQSSGLGGLGGLE